MTSMGSKIQNGHEVFLSFMGEDTRKGFTEHLYQQMVDAGISVFKGNVNLPYGGEISSSLSEAIQMSKIAVPILSKNYAASRWCLDELVCMLECRNTMEQTVIPIFYDVTPSQVRHQTGSYADSFNDHANKYNEETMEKWRKALAEVTSLTGLELEKETKGQGKLTKKILGKVLFELKKNHLYVTDELVGIDDQKNEINHLLAIYAEDVRKIVGLWGMGGIGKTTLAKVIYNQIVDKFESCSFLSDIREKSLEPSGLARLQTQLVSDLSRQRRQDFSSVDEGVNELEHMLHEKKVLILLDDVDHIDQLEALAANVNWFGPGSRIIVTTRNRSILDDLLVLADDKGTAQEFWWACFEVKEMNKEKALKLFCKHAFRQEVPEDNLSDLSHAIVETTGGLPLALEVIGSFLSRKRMFIWEETLEKLRIMPKVQERLKISYERLDDDQKQMFLDVACFFNGEDIDVVMQVWKDCSFCAEIGKDTLLAMSLIRIVDTKIWMHDQLRDLGREIVRKENYKEPSKRSRLWQEDEARAAIANNSMEDSGASVGDYAVFLSFRGADIRVEVINILYSYMKMVNIRVFRDDELSSDYTGSSLFKGMDNSKICIPIFSPKFAESRWCLSEVTRMVELKKTIIPIFYEVSPEDVKLKTSLYYDEFSKLEEKYGGSGEVDKWKNALKDVASMEGLELRDTSCTRFCINIVDEVLPRLGPRRRLGIKHLVGVDNKEEATRLLDIGSLSEEVICMGIFGMAGIGKTILAKRIYNELSSKFDHCCFLSDVRDFSSVEGLDNLPGYFFDSVQPEYVTQSWSGDIVGIFKNKKVLLILDDVDSCEQIKKIASKPSWFGLGSRIILTTRDKRVLEEYAEECKSNIRYLEMKKLDRSWVNQLFNRPSFYVQLRDLGRGIKIPKGKKKRKNKLEALQGWNYAINNMDEGPRYPGLERLSKLQKPQGIFFRIPQSRDFDLSKLVFLNLSKRRLDNNWDGWNKLQLLKKLKVLVLRECAGLETTPIFTENMGLEKLDFGGCNKLACVDSSISKLQQLNYLSFAHCSALHKLPEVSLGELHALWELDLENTSITSLPDSIGRMEKLERLNLGNCEFLIDLPESLENLHSLRELHLGGAGIATLPDSIGRLGRLEDLNLRLCESLEKLPDSLANLQSLVRLNLHSSGIRGLPSSIGKLESLEHLDLSYCSKIKVLPDSFGDLRSLAFLDLSDTKIATLPDSIGRLENLELLDLSHCRKIQTLPDSLGELKALKKLVLSHSTISQLPSTVNHLSFLQSLNLLICDQLQELPELPNSLKELKINSDVLNKVPDLSNLQDLISLELTGDAIFGWNGSFPSNLQSLNVELISIPKLPDLSNCSQLTKLKLKCQRSLEVLPNLSGLQKLVTLETESCLELLEIPGIGKLQSLTSLCIRDCQSLLRLENLGELQALRVFKLLQCEKLTEIPGFGELRGLTEARVENCDSLENLETLTALKELKEFSLIGCRRLTTIPSLAELRCLNVLRIEHYSLERLEDLGELEELKELSLIGSRHLTKIPSLGKSQCMVFLHIENCPFLLVLENLTDLQQLKHFNLRGCEKLNEIPGLGKLLCLEELTVEDCDSLQRLDNLTGLEKLEELSLIACRQLTEIPGIGKLRNLTSLYIMNCPSLVSLENVGELKKLRRFDLIYCRKLIKIPGLGELQGTEVRVEDCDSLERIDDFTEL